MADEVLRNQFPICSSVNSLLLIIPLIFMHLLLISTMSGETGGITQKQAFIFFTATSYNYVSEP